MPQALKANSTGAPSSQDYGFSGGGAGRAGGGEVPERRPSKNGPPRRCRPTPGEASIPLSPEGTRGARILALVPHAVFADLSPTTIRRSHTLGKGMMRF